MLGALLVYKFQALTEEQLQKALEQQRKEGSNKRRIGEILLDMGFISSTDLRKALDYQRSQARSKQIPAPDSEEPCLTTPPPPKCHPDRSGCLP